MEKLAVYRNLIKQQINRYVASFSGAPDAAVQEVAILDDDQGHYQWLSLGWENGRRALYLHLYVRLHEGKIWIEKDTTEDGIAAELVREGVPAEDIVLAFQPPGIRRFTDFAAA